MSFDLISSKMKGLAGTVAHFDAMCPEESLSLLTGLIKETTHAKFELGLEAWIFITINPLSWTTLL